jgi:hypothetical protein
VRIGALSAETQNPKRDCVRLCMRRDFDSGCIGAICPALLILSSSVRKWRSSSMAVFGTAVRSMELSPERTVASGQKRSRASGAGPKSDKETAQARMVRHAHLGTRTEAGCLWRRQIYREGHSQQFSEMRMTTSWDAVLGLTDLMIDKVYLGGTKRQFVGRPAASSAWGKQSGRISLSW